MSLSLLLVGGHDPGFKFEHSQAHHQIYANVSTISGFVPAQTPAEPYWFDPRGTIAGKPASYWNLKHQFQHDFVAKELTGFATPSPATRYGANTGENMVETDLNVPSANLRWTLFVNLHLHLAALLAAPA